MEGDRLCSRLLSRRFNIFQFERKLVLAQDHAVPLSSCQCPKQLSHPFVRDRNVLSLSRGTSILCLVSLSPPYRSPAEFEYRNLGRRLGGGGSQWHQRVNLEFCLADDLSKRQIHKRHTLFQHLPLTTAESVEVETERASTALFQAPNGPHLCLRSSCLSTSSARYGSAIRSLPATYSSPCVIRHGGCRYL